MSVYGAVADGWPGATMADACTVTLVDRDYTLFIEREDDELLVLDGLALVQGFLAGDPSARPGGYNDQAGLGDREAISLADVRLVNSTMRARAEHARWAPIIAADQRWLSRIPDELDLIETDDDAWATARGDQLVNEAIARCIVPYIALARSTKVLHLKRPRAFPVLDELAIQMMGLPVPDKRQARIRVAQRAAAALRREGRRNIHALRHIQDATASERTRLTLIRLLDIALWFAHPAASADGTLREITVTIRGRG
ncbi:hypothetical protein C8N24_4068 [Solirubrobacter pauli]|uniref:Uncharacterized protein n=1 Tax=Solirubrobacter pauli TaxID=166793 RepID=A0A660KZF0_9ACTN|nr:hypothetical protein C8N24_4068 [Solirubrobacter pauli]